MIDTFEIETNMGHCFAPALPFLSDSERFEFNKIGYTGENVAGEKEDFATFLNRLGKGEFVVDQTKFDSGDFNERYNIVRVY